jgi:predicted dienelactone hydrolase
VARRSRGLVFLSPGRGVAHAAYGFLAAPLADAGFLVVAIQHTRPPAEGAA